MEFFAINLGPVQQSVFISKQGAVPMFEKLLVGLEEELPGFRAAPSPLILIGFYFLFERKGGFFRNEIGLYFLHIVLSNRQGDFR